MTRSTLATISILLLIALPAAAGSPRPAPDPAFARFAELRGSEWSIRRDPARDVPRTIMGQRSTPLSGWEANRARAVEQLFEQHEDLFRLRHGIDRFVFAREWERAGVRHVRVTQTYRGVPVVGGEYAVALGERGDVRMIAGDVVVGLDVPTTPSLGASEAERRACERMGAGSRALSSRVAVTRQRRDHLVHEIMIETRPDRRQHAVLVDAHDGSIVLVTALSAELDGRGNIYPVNDKPPATPVTVTFPRLASETTLTGEHAEVHNEAGPDAAGAGGEFLFDETTSQHLTESNVYWHLDHFIDFMRARGFSMPLRIIAYVNAAESEGCGVGYANPLSNSIFLYLPCLRVNRNSGNSADVIYHEAQHLVTASYGIRGVDTESKAVSEALSDYYACAATNDPLFAEWTLIPCDRNTEHGGAARWLDSDRTVFNYSRWESVFACYAGYRDPHAVGMILAGAFWDIRRIIGPEADRLILDALDYLPSAPDFACVADAVLQANYDHHGGRYSIPVLRGFLDRGIRGAARVEIVGPAQYEDNVPHQYRAQMVSETVPAFYQWAIRPACDSTDCQPWSELGEQLTQTIVSDADFDLRVVTTDIWGRTGEGRTRVTVFTGPPPTARIRVVSPCIRNGHGIYTVDFTGTGPITVDWSYRLFTDYIPAGSGEMLNMVCPRAGYFYLLARVYDYRGRPANANLEVRYAGAASGAATEWNLDVESGGTGVPAFTIAAPVAGSARLTIYDVSGRVVARPHDGMLPEGLTTIPWARGGLDPGLYFARLTTGAGTITRKAIVPK